MCLLFSLASHETACIFVRDFPTTVNIIWNKWKAHKMSNSDCEQELVRCKDRGFPVALLALDQIRKRFQVFEVKEEVKFVQDELKEQQVPFRDRTMVVQFHKQFETSTYARLARHKCLVIVGGLQQGKTSNGMSLWGKAKTLNVPGGNCGEGVMPSLAAFARKLHDAILFDGADRSSVAEP